MPRAVPVLVLGLAILGCSKRPPATVVPAGPVATPPPVVEPSPTPEPTPEPMPNVEPEEVSLEELPRPGGVIQALAANEAEATSLLGVLGAPRELFDTVTTWRVDGRCWIARPKAGSRPADIVAAWNEALALGPSPLHWLLALGSAGEHVNQGQPFLQEGDVRAQPDGVRLCGTSSLLDLRARLDHPALRRALVDRSAVPPGSPFVATADGAYLSNRELVEGRPYVDSVEPVKGGAPALLFKLGDVDVAVVQGHDITALQALSPQVTLERAIAREPTYFLWLNPQKRWLNAWKFRAWLAGRIDRAAIVHLLFDDNGKRAFTLHAAEKASASWPLIPDPPLVPRSAPHLTLHYDDTDPAAKLLAARLRAEVSTEQRSEVPGRIDLELRPTDRDRLLEAVVGGEVEAALMVHRPETPDPVLALLGTTWWLGPEASEETLKLLKATALEDATAREQAAAEVEQDLLADARIVPLVRLKSWLATRDGLVGVKIDSDGTIRLDQAWWRR
jgi:hypothetical protein